MGSKQFGSIQDALKGFEPALPTLACRAAIELDNLLLARPSQFYSVTRLVGKLRELEEGQTSTLDPGTAVIITRAISHVGNIEPEVKTAAHLIQRTDEIRKRLENVVHDPESTKGNLDEVKELRSFCVQLSRSAAAFDNFLDEMEPTHPFRR